MAHNHQSRDQETATTQSAPMDNAGMRSLSPPPLQLVASPDKPAQFQARSVQDFPAKMATTSESDMDETAEFAAFMAPEGAFQTALQLTAAEARLACLLMLEAAQLQQDADLDRQGMAFAQQAQDRLRPQAGKGVVRRLGTEIGEVSADRAQEIFDEMAQLTFFNEHGEEMPVPYHYPPDGCYARAHLMAERLTAMGYASQKQFVVSRDQDNRGTLRVETDLGKDSIAGETANVMWNYHVAPVINVREDSGKVKSVVIDPSMTKKPVSVSEWISMMSGEQFREISIPQLKAMVDSEGQGFARGKKLTYSSDRAMMFPHGVDDSMTDEVAHRRMNAMRRRMSAFSKKGEAHKLAAEIRGYLKTGKPEIEELITYANSLGVSGKSFFRGGFPGLMSQLRMEISPDEYLNLINAIQ